MCPIYTLFNALMSFIITAKNNALTAEINLMP